MKFTVLKKTLVSSLLIGVFTFSSSYAATPVKQDAYYDTFNFNVNSAIQYISDITKKPFIANSRVYVPMSTLSELGIAKVEWVPAANGMKAELRVVPAAAANDNSAYYEQKVNELTTNIAQKDAKIKELEASVKTLTDENANLKKTATPATMDDRELRKLVGDKEYDLNRDRDFNRININGKTLNVEYTVSYRRSFDVTVGIRDLKPEDITYLKANISNQRNLEYLLKDVYDELTSTKELQKSDVYFVVNDLTNGSKTIGTYDYKYDDARLRGSLN